MECRLSGWDAAVDPVSGDWPTTLRAGERVTTGPFTITSLDDDAFEIEVGGSVIGARHPEVPDPPTTTRP